MLHMWTGIRCNKTLSFTVCALPSFLTLFSVLLYLPLLTVMHDLHFSQAGQLVHFLQLVLVDQVDTVMALGGAIAIQDTLGSIVMKC